MNKPAAKEPSMDEILSSIRQIIADDDAGTSAPGPKPVELNDELPAFDTFRPDDTPEEEEEDALELSRDQIVDDIAGDDLPSFAGLMDEPAEEPETAGFDLPPDLVMADDIAFNEPEETQSEEASGMDESATESIAAAEAAPMPDADLSSDMAESLMGATADSAVRHTLRRLGTTSLGTEGQTIEGMLKDMLRPMLKEWLDENLPSLVERLVEKEIERISRGGL